MLLRNIFSMLMLAALLASCASNPVTGKRDMVFMSTEQEIAMGTKNYLPAQQQQGGQYTVDPNLTRYVAKVGAKLAAVSDRPELPYEFVVLNNDVPNAWAMPGGKIAINRGLLMHLEDEAQLAAVIGHEIVHAAARHGAQQQSQNILVNIGLAATAIAAQKQGKFPDFHVAMMNWRGRVDENAINHAAKTAQLDIEQMRADMLDPQTDMILERTRQSAIALEIKGTPALIIGTQLIPGAISKDEILNLIKLVRADKNS